MADTFALDIAKFVKKAEGNATQVVRKIGIDTLAAVVKRTPVDTGRARANWNTSIGSPDLGVSDNKDKSGELAKARGRAVIGTATAAAPIYLMNSLPYIRRLEYEGWSKQAPAGMVRITVAEFQTFINNAVRSLSR